VAFLLAESVDVSDLKTEMLKIESLVFVATPTHKLFSKPTIDIRDIVAESILLPKHDCSYKMLFRQMLTEEKIDAETIMEFNSIETIKNCVKKGIGITLIPKIAVENDLQEGQLSVLPWNDGSLETAILMIWHKDKWISPTLQAFMDTVRSVITK
jgi:DNA-binding transcriptional LysR family regulator